ncbi:hypothetical protein CRE_19980 [Caenorhabditis remanei]|uniref:Uncharacterized protein n=1 Tax=Caenorhabditis remanei TaxID=31234 RepID=E3N8H3_CAERE|nr:hypothetical protein CRE_19980 [Caenorhabditis remanei]
MESKPPIPGRDIESTPLANVAIKPENVHLDSGLRSARVAERSNRPCVAQFGEELRKQFDCLSDESKKHVLRPYTNSPPEELERTMQRVSAAQLLKDNIHYSLRPQLKTSRVVESASIRRKDDLIMSSIPKHRDLVPDPDCEIIELPEKLHNVGRLAPSTHARVRSVTLSIRTKIEPPSPNLDITQHDSMTKPRHVSALEHKNEDRDCIFLGFRRPSEREVRETRKLLDEVKLNRQKEDMMTAKQKVEKLHNVGLFAPSTQARVTSETPSKSRKRSSTSRNLSTIRHDSMSKSRQISIEEHNFDDDCVFLDNDQVDSHARENKDVPSTSDIPSSRRRSSTTRCVPWAVKSENVQIDIDAGSPPQTPIEKVSQVLPTADDNMRCINSQRIPEARDGSCPYIFNIVSDFDRDSGIDNRLSSNEMSTHKFDGRVFTVIGIAFEDIRYSMGCIKFVNQLVVKLPTGCHAAKVAQEKGVEVPVEYQNIPGIPFKKLHGEGALEKYGVTDEHPEVPELWRIQAIFKGGAKKGRLPVLYVGWKSFHIFDLPVGHLRNHEKTLYEIAEARNKYVEVLKRQVSDKKMKALIELEQFMTPALRTDCSNRYWFLQDLTYFHSKIQQDSGQGNVHYMCFTGPTTPLPNYTFVTQHVMLHDVLVHCIEKTRILDDLFNNHLQTALRTNNTFKLGKTPCETPQSCKCNLTYEAMLIHNHFGKNTKLCIPDRMGRLQKLDEHTFGDEYVTVECSSDCGCTRNCPRRRLQNGGKKMLVIMCDDEAKGFELIAGEKIEAGELIGELAGELFLHPNQVKDPSDSPLAKRSKPDNSSSLDCTSQLKLNDGPFHKTFSIFSPDMAIISRRIGNAMRFIQHSATPNAVFIETLSRVLKNHPIIPRIAVHASKNIAIGERVTAYFHDDSVASDSPVDNPEEWRQCECRVGCPDVLPPLP